MKNSLRSERDAKIAAAMKALARDMREHLASEADARAREAKREDAGTDSHADDACVCSPCACCYGDACSRYRCDVLCTILSSVVSYPPPVALEKEVSSVSERATMGLVVHCMLSALCYTLLCCVTSHIYSGREGSLGSE